MSKKITTMIISLFVLGLSSNAQAPLPPDATAIPTTFSVFQGSSQTVDIYLTPVPGFLIENLNFDPSYTSSDLTVVKGGVSGYKQKLTVTGLSQGTHQITVTITGTQRAANSQILIYFKIDVILTVTVT